MYEENLIFKFELFMVPYLENDTLPRSAVTPQSNYLIPVQELREESCKKDIARHEIQSLKLLNEELDEKSKELIELKSAYSRCRKSLENRVRVINIIQYKSVV